MADIYNIKSNTLAGGKKVTIDSGDGNDFYLQQRRREQIPIYDEGKNILMKHSPK